MKIRSISLLTVATLAIAACSETDTAAQNNSQTAAVEAMPMSDGATSAEETGEVYSAEGDVTEVGSDQVTISHGPVDGLGWPAMTMSFRTPAPDMLQSVSVGDPVSFEFRKSGSEYVLTSLRKGE